MNYEKMYRKQLNVSYDMDKEIRLLNQKIELLIYIINLQNHYLSVPFELPAEFQINKLPFQNNRKKAN